MSNKKIVFHGSIEQNITSFKPFSHFGSRLAAAEAAYRHIHKGGKGNMTLYKVDLSVDKSNTLHIEDWGSPNSIAAALALENHYSGSTSQEFKTIREQVWEKKAHGLEHRNFGFQLITAKLSLLGVKIIEYNNHVEGDKDEVSLCIVEPKIISNIEVIAFTSNELQMAKNNIEKKYIFNP